MIIDGEVLINSEKEKGIVINSYKIKSNYSKNDMVDLGELNYIHRLCDILRRFLT